MKATRLCTGNDEKSYFTDLDIPLKNAGDIGFLSQKYPVKNIIFRETSGNYNYGWHNAPTRQFIIMIDGAVEIEAGSGEKKIFNTGDILLVEDTTGQGHISKAINGKPRKSIFVTLDESDVIR